MTRHILLSLVAAAAFATSAAAQEKIHSYHADVEVRQDGSLRVAETIRVTAAGNKVKHGIYRDFPTVYRTAWFAPIELPFEVVSVKRDGRPEPYHSERRENGVRVYAGGEDVLVPDGEHTYEIVYTTNYQLGYFADHDELYWNVTGNGWEFDIDRATASVRLPEKIPRDRIRAEGYTGPAGSKATNLTARVDEKTGLVEFATTRPLAAFEGLTIVVSFPKGYVHEPTPEERRKLFLKSNVGLWMMLGGLCAVVGYCFAAWVKVGRDPPGGLIVPQFDPPLDLSPAEMRYLRRLGYDRKCFTAAVIDLAVKGHAVIEERDGDYSLRRVAGKKQDGKQEKLSPGEQTVLTQLLPSSRVEFKQVNHQRIQKAIQGLGKQLAGEFDRKMFAKNRGWLVPGWIISALAVVAVATSGGAQALPLALFMSVWLSFWTLACAALAYGVVHAWRSARALRKGTLNRIGSYASALFLAAFATPFFIGEAIGLWFLAFGTSIWVVPTLVAVALINWWFWHLIKQPTVEGQRVRDEIDGFRMYLGTAEKEYLNRMHEPERTPELFERYLPYALALDVENEWAEKFSDVLAKSSIAETNGYSPAWYHGSNWNPAMAGAFAGGLGSSLGGAISSSATAPGSSSGSGGGGSSGGGGGGGGGGGW
jgi:uncharacterized membrane protein YgcG